MYSISKSPGIFPVVISHYQYYFEWSKCTIDPKLQFLFTLAIMTFCNFLFSLMNFSSMFYSKFNKIYFKGHSFCKQQLHDLQFMKTRSPSPNLSKLARADISCQFMKTRSLCRHCLQIKWTLDGAHVEMEIKEINHPI